MSALAFDTHAAVKALTGAGFDDAQAEAITDTVRGAVTESVATKADIARLEGKIETEVARLEAKIETEIAGVKADVAGVKADFARLEAKIETEVARLEAKIAETANRNLLATAALISVAVALLKLLP